MSLLALAPWHDEEAGGRPWYLAEKVPARCVRTAAWLMFALSLAILLGWLIDSPRLMVLIAGMPSVVPLTAFTFLCLSGVLFAGARIGEARRAGRPARFDRLLVVAGGLLTLLVGILRLGQDLVHWDFPLDLFPLWGAAREGLGEARMAPASALNFVLLGGALLLGRGRRRAELAYQALTTAALLISCLSMGHYLYGGEPMIGLAQMSVPTTALFLLACCGLLFLREDRGLVRLFRAPTEGGVVIRYLLLPAMMIPPALGWLRVHGEIAGFWDRGGSVALFTVVNISIFGSLIWSAAVWLDRADARRREADQRTHQQLERLQLLHQITRATAERQDPASIFQVAVRSIEDRLPADFSCVCRFDKTAALLEVAAIGLKSHALAGELGLSEHATFAIDPNGLERCISGLLVYEEDVAQIAMPFPQRLAAGGLRSLVLAPLQAESQVFGLMVVARRAVAGFTSVECEFLRQLCDTVALSSSQAELNAALQSAYVDLRQTQQTVIQQERLRAVGEMASGIAHDINNAISPAALHAELLLERETDFSAEGRARLETVQRAISDVAQTVSRMQELYRPRAASQNQAPIELNPLVEQVLELTRSRWRDMPQERGIVIEVIKSLALDLPLVSGIESEIREALTNLIFNAVDAMPTGGTLTLATRARKEERALPAGAASRQLVLLEVGDSGSGMDAETRQRCFEPFFTTKGDRGSGLGLSMVFSVAERHEAEVEIDSELGKGTTVRLVFPAVSDESLAEAEGAETAGNPASLRILVVDDDPILLETLSDALSGDGHRVTIASGGSAGIEAFRKSQRKSAPFDLVFTDLGMPQVDGRRVAAGIKEISPSTPIILLTGWGQRLVNEGELPPHVDLILSKPPRIKDLRQAVRRMHRRA